MFADSLLETSWRQRSRRSWTTFSSFGLQALIVGILLLLPLLRPVALPFVKPLSTPVMLAPPRGLPPQQSPHSTTLAQSNLINDLLIAPGTIPHHILNVDETAAPPPQFVGGAGLVPGGMGDAHGILGAVGTTANPVMPVPPPPTLIHLRVSRIMEGNLIRRVDPTYPPMARIARVQGSVVLSAIISKEGIIENIKVLTGHPMLVQAAEAAVKQWRYKPYILNDQAVEVETQITVNFLLGGS